MRLTNKVALVTGAGGGIGGAIAHRLVENGAKVVVTDLRKEPLDGLCERIGRDVLPLCHDVTSADSWNEVIDAAKTHFGPLNILVNNAGIPARTGQPFDAIEFDDWRNVMSVNLDGVFLGMKAAVSAMKHTGGGAIVNIASTAGFIGTRGGAAYGTSKGGVRTLTKQAAISCARHGYGIRVNAIHPGYVWTDLIRDRAIAEHGSEEKALEVFTAGIPLGRLTQPDDIAFAVVYLASDEARQITGADLVIDGGVLST